jgi:drug/metabolite transporter (DMT)-like permease
MAIGFTGVVLVVGLEAFRGHNSLGAIAIILLAAIGYTIAPMMIRRKAPELNGLAVNSVALLIAAIIFLPIGILQWPTTLPSTKSILALIALAIFPTAIAFVTYFAVMSSLGPTRASLVTYVNTAVAVLLGIAILHERLTLGVGLGLPLILAGSYLASKKSPATNHD